MAFELIDNISYKGQKFLDDRTSVIYESDLSSWNFVKVPIPEGFKVYCEETGLWYTYRSSHPSNPTTGFFVSEENDISLTVANIVKRVSSLEAQVATCGADIAQAKTDIQSLKGSYVSVLSDIGGISKKLTAIGLDISRIDQTLRDQQEAITSLWARDTACKGVYSSLQELQNTYPTAYDADFAYVLPEGQSISFFYLYVFEGSTQQWVLTKTITISTQGLLPLADVDLVNASLYRASVRYTTVQDIPADIKQFLDDENHTPPRIPIAMRKPGMQVTLKVSHDGDHWETWQFIGNSISDWVDHTKWFMLSTTLQVPA